MDSPPPTGEREMKGPEEDKVSKNIQRNVGEICVRKSQMTRSARAVDDTWTKKNYFAEM